MVDPITVTDLTQAGRLQAPDPNQPRVFVTYNADFQADSDVTLDFTIVNQLQVFGIPRAIFVDNGSNPSEVEVSVSATDQFFTVPPFAQGVFKLDAVQASKINFQTVGGATDKVTITIYNWEVAPSVWYRFGAFNKDIPVKVQGTQEAGTFMPTADNNNPVYLGGASDVDGALVPVSVDATGRLRVIGAAVGGNVFGTDNIGVAPTAAPVFIAGVDGVGNIAAITLNANDEVIVHDADLLAAVQSLAGQSKPANSNISNVNDNNVDTLILAANVNRAGATIFNDSVETLYLTVDNTAASITNFTVKLEEATYYEVPYGYTGEIRGIWSANGTGAARITEIS